MTELYQLLEDIKNNYEQKKNINYLKELISNYKKDNYFYNELIEAKLDKWEGDFADLYKRILNLHIEDAVRFLKKIKKDLPSIFEEEITKEQNKIFKNLFKSINLKDIIWCWEGLCTI